MFFESAVPASLTRRLGAHILTETMEHRPEIGLESYDRFFPNQDTLPQGGFGNLIALPLQKGPRKKGNSVFVDRSLNRMPINGHFSARFSELPERPWSRSYAMQASEEGLLVFEWWARKMLTTSRGIRHRRARIQAYCYRSAAEVP